MSYDGVLDPNSAAALAGTALSEALAALAQAAASAAAAGDAAAAADASQAAVAAMLSALGVPHRWTGTSLQLRLPNGSYGPSVDLRGPAGPTGPAPSVQVGSVTLGPQAAVIREPASPDGTPVFSFVFPAPLSGWSPRMAVVADGPRRVFQVVDWVGGTSAKPATGLYLGSGGFVPDPASAVDVRGGLGHTGPVGATGPTGAASTVPGPTGQGGVQGPTGATGAASQVPGPTGATGPQTPLSSSVPLADNVSGAAGSSSSAARADHQHPVDLTRAKAGVNTDLASVRLGPAPVVASGSAAPAVSVGALGATGAANFAAVAPGGVQGQAVGYDFYPTFQATADAGPRRAAQIRGRFNGGNWGTETLEFLVGLGGAANDAGGLDGVVLALTNAGGTLFGTYTAVTQGALDGSAKLATTAYADRAAAAGGAPSGSIATTSGTSVVAAAVDKGKVYLLAGSATLSLGPAVQVANWSAWVRKGDGAGAWTIAPTAASGSPPTIDGLASIQCYQEAFLIWWDAVAGVFRTQGRPRGWINIGATPVPGAVAAVNLTAGFGDPELRDMQVNVENLTFAAPDAIAFRVQKGGAYQTAAYAFFGSTIQAGSSTLASPTAYFAGTGPAGTGTEGSEIVLFNFAGPTQRAVTRGNGNGGTSSGQGMQTTAGAVTGLQVFGPAGANIAGATIYQAGFRP